MTRQEIVASFNVKWHMDGLSIGEDVVVEVTMGGVKWRFGIPQETYSLFPTLVDRDWYAVCECFHRLRQMVEHS